MRVRDIHKYVTIFNLGWSLSYANATTSPMLVRLPNGLCKGYMRKIGEGKGNKKVMSQIRLCQLPAVQD